MSTIVIDITIGHNNKKLMRSQGLIVFSCYVANGHVVWTLDCSEQGHNVTLSTSSPTPSFAILGKCLHFLTVAMINITDTWNVYVFVSIFRSKLSISIFHHPPLSFVGPLSLSLFLYFSFSIFLSHFSRVLGMTQKCFWWWGSSPGALENVAYFFFPITYKSTLARRDSTCLDPINRSNGTV